MICDVAETQPQVGAPTGWARACGMLAPVQVTTACRVVGFMILGRLESYCGPEHAIALSCVC